MVPNLPSLFVCYFYLVRESSCFRKVNQPTAGIVTVVNKQQ